MCIFAVAPLVGAWIEREKEEKMLFELCVAPLVGAWIERMPLDEFMRNATLVAPLVGAWIESIKMNQTLKFLMSLLL